MVNLRRASPTFQRCAVPLMAAPSHGGYAAAMVLSQGVVNQCISTYLATIGPPHADITQTAPAWLNGTPIDLRMVADAVLYGAYATLKKDAYGRLHLTFQFTASADLQMVQGTQVIGSYRPDIGIDLDATVPLTSRRVGNNWQIGVDLADCTIDRVRARILLGWLPPEYAAKVKQMAESQFARSVLNAALVALGPPLLPITMATVPAVFDYTADKPVQPGQRWFEVKLAAAAPVFLPDNGYLNIAVNVPGYTNGHPAALANYTHDLYSDAAILSSVNLTFLSDLLTRQVFPQMGHTFLTGNVRLNSVIMFQMRKINLPTATRPGIRVMLDITYFTHEFWHFVAAGETGVRATVEITGYPYLRQDGRIGFELVSLDAALPGWVRAAIMASVFILPPLTLVAPFMLDNLLSQALVDARWAAAGQASSGGLDLSNDQPLPGTSGPTFRFTPERFLYDSEEPRREADLKISMRATSRPRLTADIEGTTVSPSEGMDTYNVANNWEIPAWLKLRLSVPVGLFHPQDPTVRVRWETTFNGNPVEMYTKDVQFREPGSTQLDLFPILFTRTDRTDQELVVRCRLFRLIGAGTDHWLNQAVKVVSVDPRPDSVKPFVQWSHVVTYWNGFQKVTRRRLSKVHRVPGKGGCRFSGQYVRYPGTNKFQSLRFFTNLPFEYKEIEAHRKEICPYCFFGGPDKNAYGATSKLDLTGQVPKLVP